MRVNSVDLDEVAHYEPPRQDLRCLQIQLFSSVVAKELKRINEEQNDDLILSSKLLRDFDYKYSRTSVARTLLARLPRLFRTRS